MLVDVVVVFECVDLEGVVPGGWPVGGYPVFVLWVGL